MKWSQTHIYTLRDDPADADIPSQALMVRAGTIKKLAPGIYTYGTLALRALRKFENIIREELNKVGCTEVLMPMVHPKEVWQETNRWQEMGDGLLKFKNRNSQDFCLGATHEEVITDYARRDITSYRHLPTTLYQIQTKYRDEIRPRFGLMRGREFIMKDAYSFDQDKESAIQSYERLYSAYQKIFERLGLKFVIVQADSGNIGGDQSHEFQVLADNGEDALMVAEESGYSANVEIAAIKEEINPPAAEQEALEEFPTPGLRTIDDLSKSTGVEHKNLVKTLFYSASEGNSEGKSEDKLRPIAVLLRGHHELNEIKLKNLLGLTNPPRMLTDEEVKQTAGASPGSCGPVGLEIPIYMDQSVQNLSNYIVGANKNDVHLKGVNHGRDYKPTQVADLRLAQEGDLCPQGGVYKAFRGIEVGHVFYLGTKYSKAMDFKYLDKNGKTQLVEMGCYGIGVSRTIQAAIEQSHDKDGIIWPKSIAPFHVHVCLLDPDKAELALYTDELYEKLTDSQIEVLIDDRKERPGIKFKDADLLGMPLRVNIGQRGFQNQEIEVVDRKTKETTKLKPEEVVAHIIERLKNS